MLKNMFFISLVAFSLVACGGGGGGGGSGSNSSTVTTAFPGTVASILSFPLQAGLVNSVQIGSSTNFTVSGTCSGTASIVDSTPTSTTFEGASAFSVSSAQTINFTNCTPATTTGITTSYYDNNYLPAGINFSGNYGVFVKPVNVPATVKIGDTGTIGTENNYTDATKTVSVGQDIISYAVEPDTASSAIVVVIDKTYSTGGVLTATQQNRYRIVSSGAMTYVSADIQLANGSTTHIVLTALPDATPPAVVSANPVTGASNVSVGTAVTGTFSEAINPSTMNAATFTLAGTGGAAAGTVTYSGRTAIFTPASPLAYSTTYTATISSGVKDLAGNPMSANFAWSFTTVAAPFVSNPSPLPPLSQAVAYQVDYAHSGLASFIAPLTFPASPTWSVTLNGTVSYPLVAGGMVFVTTAKPPVVGLSPYGTSLYALNKQTGAIIWGPVAISGTYFWSGHAYDHGKLFVINYDGKLSSFDAVTGAAGWSVQLPGQSSFTSPPTAVNGIVYVGGAGSGGTLYAVDESNGNVLWTSSVWNGDHSSPAVSGDGIFVSYPCQVYKFDPLTGASLWHYNGSCTGGGGKTAAYANGQLYVRDMNSTPPGQVFNAATGVLTGTFTGTSTTTIPAFTTQTEFLQSSGTLQGIDLATHNVLWSFTGDGGLVSAPVVINQTVIVGSASGNVYAVDAVTGLQIWSGNAGAAISAPDEQNATTLTGFGAGEGYLVVPAGAVLSAWHLSGP